MPERRIMTRPYALLAASGLALAGACPVLGQSDPLSEPFPAVLELSDLDGANGFALNGVSENDRSGWSVASAGDVNGDGIDDLLVGAIYADPGGQLAAGSVYVVFGRNAGSGGFPAELELAELDGSNGFRLDGSELGESAGIAIAPAGDVNGDGLDDIIVGVVREDRFGFGPPGAAFVVYGRDTATAGEFAAILELASLDGHDGFRIDGAEEGDYCCASVASAGDVNGDGVDDFIIGAREATLGVGREWAGSSFVVFGRDASVIGAFPASVALADLDGTNGFRINGEERTDASGLSVAPAGDINADGLDDVVIGAPDAGPGSTRDAPGKSYVVFGRDVPGGENFPAVLELAALDGVIGFRLDGATGERSGNSVASAGDINGDGVDDLMIGAAFADPGGRESAGTTYVFFGRDTSLVGGLPPVVALGDLDGTDGFRLDGESPSDRIGSKVALVGDMNGDGVSDVIIGSGNGKSYVAFGRDAALQGPFPAVVGVSELDGLRGFRLDGVEGRSGTVASAGDANGDGIDDAILGSDLASAGGRRLAGRSHVVFGRLVRACPPDLNADGALTIFDFLTFQNLFDAMDPRADFDGDGDLTIFDFLAFQNAFDAGCP